MKIKVLIILLFLLTARIIAQAEYVPVDNKVYEFLERMESLHILPEYNSFEIPKSRNKVAGYIKQIIQKISFLDDIDKNIVRDLQTEFELELFGNLNNNESMIGGDGYFPFNQKEHYLFAYSDTSKFNLFVNLLVGAEGIFLNRTFPEKNLSTSTWLYGGEIRGTVLGKFGFYIKGTNGIVAGNKEAAFIKKELKSNFKLNESPDEKFFDETEGYLTADFDLIQVKFGRQKFNLGYGPFKMVSGYNSPVFDYLSFNIGYSFFNFSYYHSKISGEISSITDSVRGNISEVNEKYFGYHRIGFDLSNHLKFGLGEMIIYGSRPAEFAYLNPFNFYKSVEHSNRDRDNAMLFADISNNSVEGLKIYSLLMIDDLNAGKIGTGWWGNQTMFSFGLSSYNLYNYLPIELAMQYMRIEPYTFTHRLTKNNFTNSGYSLGPEIEPNSELFFCQINYRLNHRLQLKAAVSFIRHGANLIDENGLVIKNVGGDINMGHRNQDASEVKFLEGDIEYMRTISLSVSYEPFKRIYIDVKTIYSNNSLRNNVIQKQFESYLSVSSKF